MELNLFMEVEEWRRYFLDPRFVEARRNKLFVIIQYICVLRMSLKPLKKSVKLKLLFTMNTRRKLR